MNWAMSPEVMYHEAAHIYMAGKNPMFHPDSNFYNAGTFTLDESIAYILDEISRGSTAGLNFPDAHVSDYVHTNAAAVQNSQILAQAFHKWITTQNSTNIQMAEKILLRAIQLMQPCSGSACLDFTDPVTDVLDSMDDTDEVTGPQETAIKNDFYAAMGSVGIGPQAQPPGGNPPAPPPVPSPPVLTHYHWGCDAGISWWVVLWSTVANADTYPVYADFGSFLGTDTIPPTYIYTSNVSANVYMQACGVSGCSGPSNSVYVNDICQ